MPPNVYQEALDDLEASAPWSLDAWSFDGLSFALGVVASLVLLVALRVLRKHRDRRKAAKALAGFYGASAPPYTSHGIK